MKFGVVVQNKMPTDDERQVHADFCSYSKTKWDSICAVPLNEHVLYKVETCEKLKALSFQV